MTTRRAERSAAAAAPAPASQNADPVVQGDSRAPGPTASGQQSAALPAEPADVTPVTSDAPQQEQALRPQMPRQRVPFGTVEQKMALPDRDGFRTYWFVDKPGRIERAQQAGYDFRRDAKTGEPIKLVAGVREGGGALHQYAMEIPIEFYREDFLAEQKRLDEMDAMIKQGGKAQVDADKRYVPAATPIKIESGPMR
jgi:hypothetical protein